MTRFALIALALTGCYETTPGPIVQDCYDQHPCSPATPDGLEFRSAALESVANGDALVAVNGTVMMSVFDPSSHSFESPPFALPYRAESDAPVEVVEHVDNVITLRANGPGFPMLRLFDEDDRLYGNTTVGAAAVEHRQVRPPYRYGGPLESEEVVWAHGAHDITVALWSAADPQVPDYRRALVDESMQLAMPGATQTSWNTVRAPDAPAGHRTLVVAASSGAAVMDVETVDAPDSIDDAGGNYYPISVYGSNSLCFIARHQGRWVAGAEWSFTMDDGEVLDQVAEDTKHSGCAIFAPHSTGTAHIHVTVSGYSETLDVAVH